MDLVLSLFCQIFSFCYFLFASLSEDDEEENDEEDEEDGDENCLFFFYFMGFSLLCLNLFSLDRDLEPDLFLSLSFSFELDC